MSNAHHASHDRRKTDPIQDQLNATSVVIDKKDPNYDSENEEVDDYYLEVMDVSTSLGALCSRKKLYEVDHSSVVKPELTQEQFGKSARTLLISYFEDNDVAAASQQLLDLKSQMYHDDFVYRSIRMSMDRGDKEQQSVSGLLSHLHSQNLVSSTQMHRAFEKLIQIWEDLRLDVPDAPYRIFRFIEQTILDQGAHRQLLARCPEGLLANVQENKKALDPLTRVTEAAQILHEFKTEAKKCVEEYFAAGDVGEVKTTIVELGRPEFGHEWVRLLIRGGMDGGNKQKEGAIKCLSSLYPDTIGPDDMQLGFSRLLASIDDMVLDCPFIETLLAQCLARAVVEELLPPVFLQDHLRIHTGRTSGMSCLEKAIKLYHDGRSVNARQLQRLWKSVPEHDVEKVKTGINNCVIEYMDSNDIESSYTVLMDMDLPSEQCAEFIRKIVHYSLERGDKAVASAAKMLTKLSDTGEMTENEFVSGFEQLAKRLDDIVCDVPNARQKISDFVEEMKTLNILPRTYDFTLKK
eukprot:Platyproteum_vivax@DN3226_c0_g1_i1.p1